MRALMLKELREISGIAAVALLGYLALVVNLMGAKLFDWMPAMPSGTREVPFTGDSFTSFFGLVSAIFAIALGFRQSAWESAQGTYLFLLHRPMARRAIFLTKLATGLGVFFLGASMPIVLYAWWASIPGHHPSPFFWSMTRNAWLLAFMMPLLYLGAFLSGLRSARWFSTRLLPLAASAVLIALLLTLPWWLLSLFLTVVFYGLFVSNICFVARVRDYA